MIAGFDVGGTKANCLLLDPTDGSVVARDRASSAGSPAELVQTIVDLITRVETASATTASAVGLGIAGLADHAGIVHYSPNLPQLVEFPIGPEIEGVIGRPVIVSNDATAGAWAEARFGAGQGLTDFAFVALGTGIGTGLVVGGELMVGAHGFAGEAGHMVIDLDGPAHHTGQRGPWEYYASGTALGRQAREAAEAGGFAAGLTAAGSVDQITGTHLVEALSEGDDQAVEVFDHFCRHVAQGLANLALVLDPQRFVIGGGLADVGEPLRGGIDRWLHRLLLGVDHRPPVEVVIATMGPDAGAIGAGLLAADRPSSQ